MAQQQLRADAERNRRRILDAAAELFAEKGLSVGLDEIARHAGVGVGTAYRRFASKDELVEALFEQRISQVAVSITGLASNCLLADSAILFASSGELASTCSVTFFPTRTSETDFNPRFDNPPNTALPCGSNNSFSGITLICTVYNMTMKI